MVKATENVKREEVQEVKWVTIEKPDGVTLTLTQDEVQILRSLVGYIGGGYENGSPQKVRRFVNDLHWALYPFTKTCSSPYKTDGVLKDG
jgi:hypothetical protein